MIHAMDSKTEKVFVHEWAQLRYGVFDEHGYTGNENYPIFHNIDLDPLPNICTNDLPPKFTMK